MPIPALFVAAVAAVIALTGGAVWLFSEAKHKKLVILGNRMSGKSTFAAFLRDGVIPEGYSPTTEPETFKKSVKFKDYGLSIEVTDLSGAKAEWAEWRRQAESVELVCFLVSWVDLQSEQGLAAVTRAAKQVGSWNIKAKRMLVISFLDKSGSSMDGVLQDSRVRQIKQVLSAEEAVAVDQTNEDSRYYLGWRTLKALS